MSRKLDASVITFCIALPILGACGDDDPYVLSGTIDKETDPNDEDPTEGWPAHPEADPTESCPGLDGVCVYENGLDPKEPWVCEGTVYSHFDDLSINPSGLEIDFPINNTYHDFGVYDGGLPEVMACCDNSYTEGCGGQFPQVQSCLKDCAYQACRRFVVDLKK